MPQPGTGGKVQTVDLKVAVDVRSTILAWKVAVLKNSGALDCPVVAIGSPNALSIDGECRDPGVLRAMVVHDNGQRSYKAELCTITDGNSPRETSRTHFDS